MPSAPSSDGPVRVGVVFGGVSGEHPISIRSARTVVGALRSGANADRYRVSCFYIDRRGRWWPSAVADAILGGASPEDVLPAPCGHGDSPDGSAAGFRGFPDGALAVEVWFPVLHGPNGEDGTIQGLFTLMAVPFVGSGVLGSAVGMDKQAMKAAFAAAGLPQVPYACLESHDLAGGDADVDDLLGRLETSLGYPCFVKPANMGSSVGISKATDRASLLSGLRAAAAIDPRLVVEKGVSARELECAVLGTSRLRASVVGEIRFDADWYDYETKYSEGLSHTVIPADLPGEISERARSLALAACRAVGAAGLARVDFFYEAEAPAAVDGAGAETGRLWLNEINTLPGFTSQSMYPMLWEASGLPLADLVHELVQGARESQMHAIVTTGVSG